MNNHSTSLSIIPEIASASMASLLSQIQDCRIHNIFQNSNSIFFDEGVARKRGLFWRESGEIFFLSHLFFSPPSTAKKIFQSNDPNPNPPWRASLPLALAIYHTIPSIHCSLFSRSEISTARWLLLCWGMIEFHGWIFIGATSSSSYRNNIFASCPQPPAMMLLGVRRQGCDFVASTASTNISI